MTHTVTMDTPTAVDTITAILNAHDTGTPVPDPDLVVLAVMTDNPCPSCDNMDRTLARKGIIDSMRVEWTSYEALPKELRDRLIAASRGTTAPLVVTPVNVYAGMNPSKIKELTVYAEERAALAMAS